MINKIFQLNKSKIFNTRKQQPKYFCDSFTFGRLLEIVCYVIIL